MRAIALVGDLRRARIPQGSRVNLDRRCLISIALAAVEHWRWSLLLQRSCTLKIVLFIFTQIVLIDYSYSAESKLCSVTSGQLPRLLVLLLHMPIVVHVLKLLDSRLHGVHLARGLGGPRLHRALD